MPKAQYVKQAEVVILTADERLGQVLAAEAALCDAACVIGTDAQAISQDEWAHARVAIVDLDGKLGGSIPEQVRVLGLCRDPEALSMRARRTAHLLFRRPVLMQDLRRELSVLLDEKQAVAHVSVSRKSAMLQLQKESKCVLMGNRQISLSDKEFTVLSCLIEKGEQGLSKGELADLLDAGESNEGQVYICHLRKKLEHAFGLRLIRTVRNWGYRYEGS